MPAETLLRREGDEPLGQRAIAFAREVIHESFEGADVPGDVVQDLALKYGLIRQTEFDPKKHDGEGAEYCEPGDPWYVLSRGMKLAGKARKRRAVARAAQPGGQR